MVIVYGREESIKQAYGDDYKHIMCLSGKDGLTYKNGRAYIKNMSLACKASKFGELAVEHEQDAWLAVASLSRTGGEGNGATVVVIQEDDFDISVTARLAEASERVVIERRLKVREVADSASKGEPAFVREEIKCIDIDDEDWESDIEKKNTYAEIASTMSDEHSLKGSPLLWEKCVTRPVSEIAFTDRVIDYATNHIGEIILLAGSLGIPTTISFDPATVEHIVPHSSYYLMLSFLEFAGVMNDRLLSAERLLSLLSEVRQLCMKGTLAYLAESIAGSEATIQDWCNVLWQLTLLDKGAASEPAIPSRLRDLRRITRKQYPLYVEYMIAYPEWMPRRPIVCDVDVKHVIANWPRKCSHKYIHKHCSAFIPESGRSAMLQWKDLLGTHFVPVLTKEERNVYRSVASVRGSADTFRARDYRPKDLFHCGADAATDAIKTAIIAHPTEEECIDMVSNTAGD
jgi:hypothetical protein